MARYRKKPVEIEAFQLIVGQQMGEWPSWAHAAIESGQMVEGPMPDEVRVETTEGVMSGRAGDWIIRGVEGELYPCKDSVFQKTYDLVPEPGTRTCSACAGRKRPPADCVCKGTGRVPT